MKRKMVWLVVSCLMVLALLAASCTKAETPAAKEAAPATKATAPATKEAIPAVKETIPAAAETPKYGGALVTSRSSNILNWDEALLPMWTLSSSLNPTNENLLMGDWAQGPAGTNKRSEWYTGNYVLVWDTTGSLAESWELPDDQTIIFHIRKGVHWTLDPNNAASRLVGGRELTADDVVFCLKRQFWDPKTTSYTVAGEARPLDVSASDKYTVVVKTPKDFQGMTWEYAGHNVRIMPPEVAQKYGDYTKWENNVGTGPFILKDFVNGSSATWVRNPNYWDKDPVGPGKGNQLPYVDSLKQLIVIDQSTRMAALRTGKIDTDETTYVTLDAQQLVKTTPDLKYFSDLSGYPIIGMRLDKPGLPWGPQDDPNAIKVRRALNLAVNDQEMCDVLFSGEGTLLSYKIIEHPIYKGIYTPMNQLPQDSRELFEYHPDKAKQLLTEAGYPNGFKALVELQASPAYRVDMASMIKAYWAKIGVDLEMRIIDPATYQTYQLKHTHTQMYFYGRSSFNPQVMYSSKTGDMYNMSIVSDPILDKYYRDMSALYFDRAKRDPMMKEMNLYAISRSHYIYGPVNKIYRFWQPWLKNYHGESSVGSFSSTPAWKYVWLDQELRKSTVGR